jgi:hypothetical protein
MFLSRGLSPPQALSKNIKKRRLRGGSDWRGALQGTTEECMNE